MKRIRTKALTVMAGAILLWALGDRPTFAQTVDTGMGWAVNNMVPGVPVTSVWLYWNGSTWVFAHLDPWFIPQSAGQARDSLIAGFTGWWMDQFVWWSYPQGRSIIGGYSWGYNVRRP
jgi:hypothetical protein